jgi:NAD-dependent dihydropyrimidine dehydrogenase PreA subunit
VKDINMTEESKPDRGLVRIDGEECKGCGLCVESCPPRILHLGDRLNRFGYRTAVYAGAACTGCGICFLACPEPGAITVLRLASSLIAQPRPIEGASPCASN